MKNTIMISSSYPLSHILYTKDLFISGIFEHIFVYEYLSKLLSYICFIACIEKYMYDLSCSKLIYIGYFETLL